MALVFLASLEGNFFALGRGCGLVSYVCNIIYFLQNLSASVIMTGTPGRDFSSGGVFYYSPAGTPNSFVSQQVLATNLFVNFYMNTLDNLDISLLAQAAAVNASNGDDGDGAVNAPLNDEYNYTYYGEWASCFLHLHILMYF